MTLSRLTSFDWPQQAGLALAGDVALAALVSAAATLGLVLAFAPWQSGRGKTPKPAEGQAPALDFLIDGSRLKPMTTAARGLLERLPPGGGRLAALVEHLGRDCPGVGEEIEALILHGTSFRRHLTREDGSAFELVGEPRGGAAFLAIRPASEDARGRAEAEAELGALREELKFLRGVIDRAPVLAWSLSPDGQANWANAAFRERFDEPKGVPGDRGIPSAFGHVLDEVPLTQGAGGANRSRVAVTMPANDDPHWFEISQTRGPDGETVGYALDAGDLVAAEASLRRFIETLTETFAHLPIGLAVFDKNRRLGIFNPALTELVRIDSIWLAGRPSLRDFLERLRETRQMPEQKDFSAWRRKLGELEEGARDGTYEENWVLPSGKVFRVTGRPHPQGALAFLFEDISATIVLERRYRAELELSQAVLDRMCEAVAVFDTSGMLVFVNTAFASMWGTDPMESLQGPGIAAMTALWQERCVPSPAWADLRDYATGAETRTSWTADLETLDARALHMLAAPLPDGSTLVVFRDLSEERERIGEARGRLAAAGASLAEAAVLTDLALEELRVPVEAAIRGVAAAIPAVQTSQAFQGLNLAAQLLREALARSRELQALGSVELGKPGSGPDALAAAGTGQPALDPVGALGRLLRMRGLTLAEPQAAGAPTGPAFARALAALGLAIADLAKPGASVTLMLEPEADHIRLVLSAAAGPAGRGGEEALGVTLARRVLARFEAVPEIVETAGDVRVAVRLSRVALGGKPVPSRRRAAAKRG